jgi:hypothetical protein
MQLLCVQCAAVSTAAPPATYQYCTAWHLEHFCVVHVPHTWHLPSMLNLLVMPGCSHQGSSSLQRDLLLRMGASSSPVST